MFGEYLEGRDDVQSPDPDRAEFKPQATSSNSDDYPPQHGSPILSMCLLVGFCLPVLRACGCCQGPIYTGHGTPCRIHCANNGILCCKRMFTQLTSNVKCTVSRISAVFCQHLWDLVSWFATLECVAVPNQKFSLFRPQPHLQQVLRLSKLLRTAVFTQCIESIGFAGKHAVLTWAKK